MAGGPASHACRRGSGSTRGFNFFVLGGSFTRSGVDGTRGLGVGGFNPLRGATTGVVMRRRATSGEMARGGLVFCFFFGGCSSVGGGFFHMLGSGQPRMPPQSDGTPPCGGAGEEVFGLGDSITRSGVDGTRGLGVGGLIRCAGRPREWSCGAVPPQERWHEGGWFLFFLWRLLRCRRGIVSHARERQHEGL